MADVTTPPGTLPVHLTSFVGRRAELAAVAALLGGRRLVTLTGVGGSGKTRLAARLAADQADRWADGVWWVGLEAVVDGAAPGPPRPGLPGQLRAGRGGCGRGGAGAATGGRRGDGADHQPG